MHVGTFEYFDRAGCMMIVLFELASLRVGDFDRNYQTTKVQISLLFRIRLFLQSGLTLTHHPSRSIVGESFHNAGQMSKYPSTFRYDQALHLFIYLDEVV
jgi:hypothetical protein